MQYKVGTLTVLEGVHTDNVLHTTTGKIRISMLP